MATAPVIEIRDLRKTYKGSDTPAVDGISLSILPGEIFGLLGPNGAGKTTTLAILCGLFPASGGSVKIRGLALDRELEKIKYLIGVVPQDLALYPALTALENLTFFGNMYGLRGSDLHDNIMDHLKTFGLENAARKKVGNFSGGMKRRVNLIAGLLHKPAVLILDEPTVGIDVQSRVVILDYLRLLNRNGTTIVYTSHYMEEAEQLCTRVAIVDRGRIIAEGPPGILLTQHPEFKNLENIYLHLTGKETRD